jgi:hypothetical protein
VHADGRGGSCSLRDYRIARTSAAGFLFLSETVYFTVIPTPRVASGANGVAKLDLETRQIHVSQDARCNLGGAYAAGVDARRSSILDPQNYHLRP